MWEALHLRDICVGKSTRPGLGWRALTFLCRCACVHACVRVCQSCAVEAGKLRWIWSENGAGGKCQSEILRFPSAFQQRRTSF